MRYVTSIERIGQEKGKAEGKAEALIRLSEKRFGPLPEPRRQQIMAADAATIDAWFDRAIDAPDLKSVFDPTH